MMMTEASMADARSAAMCEHPRCGSRRVARPPYHAWSRLVKIVDGESPSAASGEFAYDGLGRVTARIIGESWTHRFYDSSWRLLEESWADDEEWSDRAAHRQYVWDLRYIDAPVCMDVDWSGGSGDGDCTDPATDRAGTGGTNTGDEHLYYTQDANFNVTGLVDAYDGAVVQRYSYTSYGMATVLAGVRDIHGVATTDWSVRTGWQLFQNPFLYCGYYSDTMFHLYHVRNRVYNPNIGTWMQRDPGPGDAGPYADGMNLYQYCQSKPVSATDPDGLWGRETHWGDPERRRLKGTYDIAIDIGFSDRCARVLADWDQGVDDVTPAWAFPYFHFEPGRSAIAEARWDTGVRKLNRANVYSSPWIWDVCVYDGLAHIGEALHGYQDAFAHIAEHHADTGWKHITGPNSGYYSAELAARTRFHNEGDSLNSRPDDPDLWPTDHAATLADTRAKLEEIWKIPSVQCHCTG